MKIVLGVCVAALVVRSGCSPRSPSGPELLPRELHLAAQRCLHSVEFRLSTCAFISISFCASVSRGGLRYQKRLRGDFLGPSFFIETNGNCFFALCHRGLQNVS